MFEFISFGKRKTPGIEIPNQELNRIMSLISSADDFKQIEKDFNQLYDATVHRMWGLLSRKFIPPLTEEDVRDIFQEAWIKVIERRKDYNSKYNAFSWIYVIKKNMLIDRIRQVNRTYVNRIEDDERDIIEEIPETSFSFFDDLTSKETIDIILDAIRNISDDRDREIVERRLVHEQKLEQISKEMGIPLATVFKIIKRRIEGIKPKVEYLLNN